MSERAMTNTRETLAGIREHAGNVTVVRMAEALEAVLDLADQLDFENQAMRDFYSLPSNQSEQTQTPAARIRKTVVTALEGKGENHD